MVSLSLRQAGPVDENGLVVLVLYFTALLCSDHAEMLAFLSSCGTVMGVLKSPGVHHLQNWYTLSLKKIIRLVRMMRHPSMLSLQASVLWELL